MLGAEAALSKSTVSRICQRIRTEFDAWKSRDLAGVRLDYLFLDGSHFKMHPGAPAEPVLAAWGIDTDGKPVFVGLAPASSELAGHNPHGGAVPPTLLRERMYLDPYVLECIFDGASVPPALRALACSACGGRRGDLR